MIISEDSDLNRKPAIQRVPGAQELAAEDHDD
jgi:hypothetical protein